MATDQLVFVLPPRVGLSNCVIQQFQAGRSVVRILINIFMNKAAAIHKYIHEQDHNLKYIHEQDHSRKYENKLVEGIVCVTCSCKSVSACVINLTWGRGGSCFCCHGAEKRSTIVTACLVIVIAFE